VQNAFQALLAGPGDAFLTKLSPGGDALEFSTYFGGKGYDSAFGIGIDFFNSVYLIGTTSSTDFPTLNPFQTANAGGGNDGFVAKFDTAGSKLVYSSYLGGEGTDYPFRIAVDIFGGVSIAGFTTSRNFPVVNAVQSQFGGGMWDAFVTKVSRSGSRLVYSTYLGGTGDEFGYSIYSDLFGGVWVGGSTSSLDFPTVNAFQPKYGGGPYDAFLTQLKTDFLSILEELDETLDIVVDVPPAGIRDLHSNISTIKQEFQSGNSSRALAAGWLLKRQVELLITRQRLPQSTATGLGLAVDAVLSRLQEAQRAPQ
jgi:hypothetical protein